MYLCSECNIECQKARSERNARELGGNPNLDNDRSTNPECQTSTRLVFVVLTSPKYPLQWSVEAFRALTTRDGCCQVYLCSW